MGERVRHSPLPVSGKGRDPCRQHGNGRRNAGKSCFLQKCPGGEKKKRKSGLDSVLCRGTVALWLMLVFCELPPAGCLPMGQHCPAQLHGRRGNSMAGAAALISLSQRYILSS